MNALSSELRLKVLKRLVMSPGENAQAALNSAFQLAVEGLASESQFEKIAVHLETISAIGSRFSGQAVGALEKFLDTAENRSFDHAEGYEDLAANEILGDMFGPPALMVKAMDALATLRYLETRSVIRILLPFSAHHWEKCRSKALQLLEQLASYEMSVFYGTEASPGIGAYPQQEALGFLETLSPEAAKANLAGALVLTRRLLSEQIQGTDWSYNKMTLSRTAIPATEQISEIRRRTIAWAVSLYPMCESVSERLRLLELLNSAARMPRGASAATAQMVVRDTLAILSFYNSLVPTECVQILEKLESRVYWIFFHSPSDDVCKAALRFKTAVDQHAEYQIFKVLIGFEGVFGEWSRDSRRTEEFEQKDKLRKVRALQLVESISPNNVSEWRERVLRYSAIESNDLATFPVYIFFLEQLGTLRPYLALELLSSYAEQVDKFLVPLLRGLVAAGQYEEFTKLIEAWASQGVHLVQCAYALENASTFNIGLLELVLQKSIQEKNIPALIAVLSVAVVTYADTATATLQSLFVIALSELSKLENPNWIYEVWFRPQTQKFLTALEERHIDLVLDNLMFLERIEYQAEEILFIVAGTYPAKVLTFFVRRINMVQAQQGANLKFEAVPYELLKLNERLARYPTECVVAARLTYRGDYGSLIYGGAQLLKTIFPSFPPEFEGELLKLVHTGEREDLEFVLAVLRSYDGGAFLAHICLEIVETLPLGDPLLVEIEIILESTGIVVGEYGFANALEEKQREASAWLDSPSEKVRAFAKDFTTSLMRRISEERTRATEQIALRKARYGEYE